jgi:hypothetical protein
LLLDGVLVVDVTELLGQLPEVLDESIVRLGMERGHHVNRPVRRDLIAAASTARSASPEPS